MTLSKEPSSQISESPIGVVTDIQRYSIKDGPGIRTTIFLKGCSLACEWCANPEAVSPHPELLINHNICIHCGDCVPVCPTHAFRMENDKLQFDRNLCNACGDCVSCCPEQALEIVGKRMLVEEVLDEALRDQVFYQVSGGGVTFSGGEPLLQPEFVSAISKELKASDVHVAIDTAGNVSWDSFELLLPFMDLVLYDIKFIDDSMHERYTGVDNHLILDNARRIAARGVNMIVRLVIVPGLNDSEEELQARIDFVRSLKVVDQIDLLPYHRLGVGKYSRLGKSYLHQGLQSPEELHMGSISNRIREQGFQVTIGG